jgi:hypothetical protein
MMNAVRDVVTHQYIIHGFGNSITVQARLAQHGQCFHTEWDPGPPSWRMTYETTLGQAEVAELVKDLIARYDLKISPAD